jgi:hypothetical protein
VVEFLAAEPAQAPGDREPAAPAHPRA